LPADRLSAIGQLITERGEHVSAFYTSNVEFYVMSRQERFENFVATSRNFHMTAGASSSAATSLDRMGIRIRKQSPAITAVNCFRLSSLVKESESGGYQSYLDLVSKHSLELRVIRYRFSESTRLYVG
jgi:hypothetical protein